MDLPSCDENGDLLFATPDLGRLALKRRLPNLRWLGIGSGKRGAWYAPDPNAWGREVVRAPTGEVAGVRLFVPRRYQWFVRIVWGTDIAALLTTG